MILPHCDDATRDACELIMGDYFEGHRPTGEHEGYRVIILLQALTHILVKEGKLGHLSKSDLICGALFARLSTKFAKLYEQETGNYPEHSSVELAIGFPES